MVSICKLNPLCLMPILLHRFERLDEFVIGSSTILVCGLSIDYEIYLSFDLRSTIYQRFSDIYVQFWFEIKHSYTIRNPDGWKERSWKDINNNGNIRITRKQWLIHKYLYCWEKISFKQYESEVFTEHWTLNTQ